MDIDAAFRNIPVLPEHKPYLVIQCKTGEFYIDHVVCFGIASGVGLQGAVMDALIDYLSALELGDNDKWVDDLLNLREPIAVLGPDLWRYGHDMWDIIFASAPLGVRWSLPKCFPHAFEATYNGFRWFLITKRVGLPEEKRTKYLARVDHARAQAKGGRGSLTWKDATTLNGTLSHITFVYPAGRARLPNLCAFIADFGPDPFPGQKRHPARSVAADLDWWHEALSVIGHTRKLVARGRPVDPDIWVDASTDWGIGLVVGNSFAAWRWKLPLAEWRTQGRDIGWAEMVAVELAVLWLEQTGWADKDVIVRSDNQGVIDAIKNGRSRNFQVNLVIRRTDSVCMAQNIRLDMRYVESKTNRADPVSRGVPDDPLVGDLEILYELPPELTEYLERDA